ncbi:siroheme synthase CysG [Algicella marina]|uniref:Uroporphyrinogen-III C-methyltransferase n=1 Tax=Algicella marina TaxID=2683284 RepID=A0A6P1T1S1_9RHOB|nr:siroheme synthase CysG [Algicella marina]QHQ36864.1 uroporphyrinogen-III C-methyltransferase [Algicella marina]
MKTFPMFLRMAGRDVVILGGGEEAAQKTRLMLKTEATIIVAAPALEPELSALAAGGRIRHHTGPVDAALLANAALVFAASGCPGTDAAHARLARALGRVVNAVDQPDLCDAFTPSLVDRDPVVVAIGTEGTAPILARQIKTQVEAMLEPRLGDLAAFAGRMREAVAVAVPRTGRRKFWNWVFAGSPRHAHGRGAQAHAYAAVKQAVAKGAAPVDEAGEGVVSLVGAGPGSGDLITLRGVQRLQEADIILHDRLVGAEVLELARRDAERICVGKASGDAALPDRWSQERINRLIVAEARRGRRVVRLKCGDPGIFARGAEEAAACRAAGINCEIVPGITSASAAMAASGGFLTERGEVDTLVLTTATGSDGGLPPAFGTNYAPGTQYAVYMGVGAAARIEAELVTPQSAGHAVTIVQSASHSDQRIVQCTLGTLSETVRSVGIAAPAIILIRNPKEAVAVERQMEVAG